MYTTEELKVFAALLRKRAELEPSKAKQDLYDAAQMEIQYLVQLESMIVAKKEELSQIEAGEPDSDGLTPVEDSSLIEEVND